MTTTSQAEAEPIRLNNESQLFVDDYLVAQKTSVLRRLNRPRKEPQPLLEPEHEWEGQSLLYGVVIEHQGAHRLYYKTREWSTASDEEFRASHGFGKLNICLATSTDGVNFARDPVEGAVHAGTNIVVDDPIDCFGIVKDGAEPDPEKRFKMLASAWTWRNGMSPATSPDGVRWQWGERYAIKHFGDRCAYWYDPVRQKHVAWSRNWQMVARRVIVHKDTDDFDQWSEPQASPNKLVLAPDRDDHPDTQFYGGYGFWYRSMYLAYIEVFYVHLQRLDTQLACSRDGLTWQRLCDREIFLPNGEHGEHDAYWIVPTFNLPVCRDGEMLIHYHARPDPHRTPGFTHLQPGMGGVLGLSRLREDGFVSLDATGAEGVVETKPLELPADRSTLEVNICPFTTRPGIEPMRATVEVLDAAGELIETHQIPAPTDPQQVWHIIEPAQPLPDVICLRFRAVNARLYSFRFPVSG